MTALWIAIAAVVGFWLGFAAAAIMAAAGRETPQ